MNFIEDQSKTIRQEESIQKWRNAKGIGTLLLCPRFGKTKIGVTIINRIINKNDKSEIIVLTPSEYITNYWKSYFTDKQLLDNKITIISIDTYNKDRSKYRKRYDLVVVDEIHKMLSEVRYACLNELHVMSKWWLNLLGIMPNDKGKIMIESFAPVIDEITVDEAMSNNWVSDSIEYNLALELSDDDKLRYIRFTNMISETIKLFDGVHNRVLYNNQKIFESDFDLIYACYTGKKVKHGYVEGIKFREMVASVMGWQSNLDLTIEYNDERNKYWNPNAIYERTKLFTTIVKQRNEILANNEIKLNCVVDIIKKYNSPTIVFNESIDFVTKIADSLGKDAIAYHSKIESRPIWDDENNDWFRYKDGAKKDQPKMFGSSKIKDETIKGIISGKYKYLITAKALDEGLTIPNLEIVIITAGSTNPIQQGQRIGRGCTIDNNNPNKQTKVFNLYFDDIILEDNKIIKSRDKTKLIERQGKNAIYLMDLNEIS